MGAWNWLDWTLTVIVVGSVAAAAHKGFVRELIGLASLVAGLAVAAAGYRRAAPWVGDLMRLTPLASGAAFLTLFVLVMILGAVPSLFAQKVRPGAGLPVVDSILGACLGLGPAG